MYVEESVESVDDYVDDSVENPDEPLMNRRTWEAEVGSSELIDLSVQGRLKEKILFWKDVLKAPSSVLCTIESGYILPLSQLLLVNVTSNQQLLTLILFSKVCQS